MTDGFVARVTSTGWQRESSFRYGKPLDYLQWSGGKEDSEYMRQILAAGIRYEAYQPYQRGLRQHAVQSSSRHRQYPDLQGRTGQYVDAYAAC